MITDFHKEENSFLSNFYPCKVEFEGMIYPSVEHAYQAAKTEDLAARKKILSCKYAGQAKKLGRQVKQRENWEEVRESIMMRLLHRKFQDPILKRCLLNTSAEGLAEHNYWHDTFWGRCFCSKHCGSGKNILGKLLMELREHIQIEER